MGLFKSKPAEPENTGPTFTYVRLEVPGQKFWTIDIDGATTTTTYGKIGAEPKESSKTHSDAAAATAFYDKQIEEKKAKGYSEPGPPEPKPKAPPKPKATTPKKAAEVKSKKIAKAATSQKKSSSSPPPSSKRSKK